MGRLRLPAEWEPHERTLIGWPCRVSLWGETLPRAREDYASVANAIAAFEPVTMIANPGRDAADARGACSLGVEIVELPLDDSWLRDCGPIYVYDDAQRRALHFRFNAWGEKFAPWDRDAAVGGLIAERLEDSVSAVDLVLEGGSILSDGAGTLLTTEQCLLSPNRNPSLDREEIARRLTDALGLERIVWLGEGLIEDRDTDGHVDLIAAFTRPGQVLLQTVPDDNPNSERLLENRTRIRDAGIDVIELPHLPYVEVGGVTVAAGYLNLYLCKGAVIVPVTGADTDPAALEIIAGAFPGREVVSVPGAALAFGGGGPHCVTQQVPVRREPLGAASRAPAVDPAASELITAYALRESPARTRPPTRPPLRLGLVQSPWHPDPGAHEAALADGIARAAAEGARIVCLQELTLSRYFAISDEGPAAVGAAPEDLESGPTIEFARRCAAAGGVHVHASLYERADGEPDRSGAARSAEAGSRAGRTLDGLGYNTAILVAPDGRLVSRTRKLHIPVTAGYHEDRYFRPGPADGAQFPVTRLQLGGPAEAGAEVRLGLPTCWDQWFPELARAYSLAGAEVLVYPTAIGSEPDHPGFDTEPLWQQVIVANGIANGTFMVAVNRIGTEGPITFYGSSFISDPYGRILAQAPRDRPAVIVADLDLDQRGDWLELFPFLTTRRPDAYGALTDRRHAASLADVPIRGERIRLGQLLKLAGMVDAGAEVKALLAEQAVTVNGEPESRRGRQLQPGDVVRVGGRELRVASESPPVDPTGLTPPGP